MRKLLSFVLAAVLLLALCAPGMQGAAEGKYVKLTWVMGTGTDAPTDQAIVEEELNKITREKLGCEVTTLYMKNEQCMTSIQAGEVYDMYFTCDWYNDYVTQSYAGIFADITELVKTVTPELYATMPEEVWELAKVDGKIFAIPVKKDYCPEIFVRYDKEFFDSIGMKFEDNMDFCDLTDYLKAYQEAHPDAYAWEFAGYPGGIDGTFNFINRTALIGFPYSAVGTENATKIISVFEDEEMMRRFTKMHEWFQAGYIAPDAATATTVDETKSFFKLGQGFYGADAIWSAANKYAQGISRISGPYLSKSGVCGSMNAISAASSNIELCLKFQELVNTDLAYRDMLRYGIEGVHFNYNEDKTVTKTEAGIKNYNPWAFSQGSYALSSVEASNFDAVPADPNMWEVVFKGYENALVAADCGFTFDPSDYEMEISMISTIKDKWLNLIYSGTADPAEAIPQVLEEMRAAGLDTVIQGAQAQLDAYLAGK